MNDTIGMSVSKHFAYLNSDLEFFRLAEVINLHLIESCTLDQFEHQNISVFSFYEVINTADMGVFQFRKELSFSDQLGFGLFMEALLSAKSFKGHFAFKLFIITNIYFSHPPFSYEIYYAKMIDFFPEQGPCRVLVLGGFLVMICCRAALIFFQFSLPKLWDYTYHSKILQ